MESNVCKKPALAGVCAAQRQIFGPLRGPKIETLGRLSEKSMDFFDSLRGRPRASSFFLSVSGSAKPPSVIWIGRGEAL